MRGKGEMKDAGRVWHSHLSALDPSILRVHLSFILPTECLKRLLSPPRIGIALKLSTNLWCYLLTDQQGLGETCESLIQLE